MGIAETITVSVVYVTSSATHIETVYLTAGEDVAAAIHRSGLLQRCPDIDLQHNAVGIFGKRCALSDCPQDGGRIEIYRPLLIDPKTARRRRAEKNQQQSRKTPH